jgi:hypothetical protein
MKFRSVSMLAVLSVAMIVLCAASSLVRADDKLAESTDPKLESIFNGKDLAGWKITTFKAKPKDANTHWQVKDGILISENDEKMTGSLLATEKQYKDFIVELDAKWTGEVDSGIYVRKPNGKGSDLQLQFGVSRSLKKDMTCSFYTGTKGDAYPEAGRGKNVDKLLKEGEWNHFKLQCRDNTFTAWLNGEKVTEYTNEKYSKPGPIGLQIHPGLKMRVDFKDIKVAELK